MSLTKQVFTGLKWSALTRLGAQILTWAITLLVIRILTPSDYGLLAIAVGVAGVLSNINSLGMAGALIQRQELEPGLSEKVFAILILANAAFFVILFSLAPLVATFYEEPALKAMVRVLALNHVLFPMLMMARVTLMRAMDFRRLGIVMLIASVASGLLTLGLAYSGFGVWSLVYGNVFGTVMQLVGLLLVTRSWCRPLFHFEGTSGVLKFGLTNTADGFVESMVHQGDSLVVGKLLGKESTGVFYVAKDFSWLLVQKIGPILNPVAFVGFSRAQNDPAAVTRYVLKAASMIAMIAFPMFFGISAVSPELVSVVFGQNWLAVIEPLAILAPFGVLQMLGLSLEPAVKGVGRPIFNLYFRITTLVLLFIGIVAGARWGLPGVVAGVAAAFTGGFLVQLMLSTRVLKVPVFEFLAGIWKPMISAVVMYFAVDLARASLEPFDAPQILTLVMLIATGVLAYLVMMLLIDFRGVAEMLAKLRSGKSPST